MIGVLSGSRAERRPISNPKFVLVPCVSVSPSILPEVAAIENQGKLVDGQTLHHVAFHFEDSQHSLYSRLLIPPSTPYWLAVGRGLLDCSNSFEAFSYIRTTNRVTASRYSSNADTTIRTTTTNSTHGKSKSSPWLRCRKRNWMRCARSLPTQMHELRASLPRQIKPITGII